MTDRDESDRLGQLAGERHTANDFDEAERLYRAAIEAAPDWSVPHYNYGLFCKYRLRWEESYAHNARAMELSPGDEAAIWNLGIAATALGRWSEARRAWAAYGIEIPPGDGPPQCDWSATPVRLDPDTSGEVVWAKRLCPARARIENIPLPTSRFRWGDVVLNDGAPQGERIANGRTYPVFNVLQRLEPSGFETFVVELVAVDDASVLLLESIADASGGWAENWGETTRILCRQCSYGEPHEHLDGPGEPAHPHCGIAARSEAQANEIIERWLAKSRGMDVMKWYAAPAQ